MEPTVEKISLTDMSTGKVTAAGIEADMRRAMEAARRMSADMDTSGSMGRAMVEHTMSSYRSLDTWAADATLRTPVPPIYQPAPTIKHLGKPKVKS